MTDLKQLELSQSDFDMIDKGLDKLSSGDFASDMLMDIFGGSLLKDDEAAKTKFELEKKVAREKKELEQKLVRENIKILQGKLLSFKRYLTENSLMKQAEEIISTTKP